MYFALVTGHFQLPQFTRTIPDPKRAEVGNDAISVWMLDHPDIYQAATLAAVRAVNARGWPGYPVATVCPDHRGTRRGAGLSRYRAASRPPAGGRPMLCS